jgi:hypothetical protein
MSTEWVKRERKPKKNKSSEFASPISSTGKLTALYNVPPPKEEEEEDLLGEFESYVGGKEGFDVGPSSGNCPHIFQDVPMLKYIIYMLKHIFDAINYSLQYISTHMVHIFSKEPTEAELQNDITWVYKMLYLTVTFLVSFVVLRNVYYVTFFANESSAVRSALANGKILVVTSKFFYDIIGLSKENDTLGVMGFMSILEFFTKHIIFPVSVLSILFLNGIPYLLNIVLPNKVIWLLLHAFILYVMIKHGTMLKEFYMTLFNQSSSAQIDTDLLNLIFALITLSILMNLLDFCSSWFKALGSRIGIVTVVIILLMFLLQVVVSYMFASAALFLIAFFVFFYSFMSITAFARITDTLEVVSKYHLDDIRPDEEYSIFKSISKYLGIPRNAKQRMDTVNEAEETYGELIEDEKEKLAAHPVPLLDM